MTATSEVTAVAVRDPRTLLDPWPGLFDKIVARIQEDYAPVATFYAETVVEQALAYLATTTVYNPQDPPFPIEDEFRLLTPSKAVDVGIHAFLDFTREWREFSAAMTGGKFIDHIPVTNESITSGRSLHVTVRAMRHYGWRVDERMWERGASCGSTDNCFMATVTIT